MKTIKLLACLGLFIPTLAFAHPGNTDAYGCHTCRTNCAKWGLSQGEYHCHRSKGLEQPKEPVKSSAKGVTVPAPEYKQPKATTTSTSDSIKSETKVLQKSFFQTVFGFFR